MSELDHLLVSKQMEDDKVGEYSNPLPHIALKKWLKAEANKNTNHWIERDTYRRVLRKLEDLT